MMSTQNRQDASHAFDPHPDARVITDRATGRRWEVRELPCAVPSDRGAVQQRICLVAFSTDVVRRFRHVPPAWREMPAADLLAIIDGPPAGTGAGGPEPA